ncbi:MAG: DUF981 family protein [Candidatus Micrarchaeaceae archaeon]|jgi:putative membrane protein
MVFIDNLAYSLFAISFAGFLILYTIISIYLAYRKKQKDFSSYLKSAIVPLAFIGIYMLLMGLWGQFTWPLPGSYNTLFYDPLISFGILLLTFSISIKYNVKLQYVGFLGLMVGIMVIGYGITGYQIGLTAAPVALLLMYLFYGFAGIFSYPTALIADRLPGFKKNFWKGWHLMLILFLAFILLASCISAFVGAAALTQHLITAP